MKTNIMNIFKTIKHAYKNHLDTPLTALDHDRISIIKISEDRFKVVNPGFELLVSKNGHTISSSIPEKDIMSTIETSIMKNI